MKQFAEEQSVRPLLELSYGATFVDCVRRELARPALATFSGIAALVQLAMTFSLLGNAWLSPDSHATTTAIFGLLTVWVAVVSIVATRDGSRRTARAIAQPSA